MTPSDTPAMQNNARRDEMELVTRAQRGDRDAFAELIGRHRSSSRKLATSILRNWEDAEDEVQNAAWKAWRSIGGFQGEARFLTWFTRILVNQCLMRLRRGRPSRFLSLDDVKVGEDYGALDLPDARATPEQQLAESELAHVLRTEIRRIPPLLRHALVLRDVEQRDMPEVASRLGVSPSAAKSRLLRARRELRNRMLKHAGRHGTATLFATGR
ncbi:MAG: sigma-70 family RNA polymerase sigma factor [Bryobacteraceae bacterium]|nr:sigma-70 family RNA polymerase sigma factor [Bryobacteraceae bacterium]